MANTSRQQISHKGASTQCLQSCKRSIGLSSSFSDEGASSQDKRKKIAKPHFSAVVDLRDISTDSVYKETSITPNVVLPKRIAKNKKKNKEDRCKSRRPKIEGQGSSDTIDKYSYTKLYQAVINVNKKAVEEILSTTLVGQLKKIINQQDEQGYTPLYWCLDSGILAKLNPFQAEDYLSIFKLLLNNPNCDVSMLDVYGKNLLHWAVISQYVEAIKVIFDKARDDNRVKRLINQMDCWGYAPLHYLVLNPSGTYSANYSAILKQFLDHPICNINIEDDQDLPELYWLINYKQPKLAKELLESERLETFVQFTCRKLVECYSSELTDSERLGSLKSLSHAVVGILSASVQCLRDSDQGDPDITNAKKLLLKRYFGLDASHRPIKKELDILNLIRKSNEFDKEMSLMSKIALDEFDEQISEIMDSGEFDEQIELRSAPDEPDNIVNQIIESSESDASDQVIEPMLGVNRGDLQKALKGFIEGICKWYRSKKIRGVGILYK